MPDPVIEEFGAGIPLGQQQPPVNTPAPSDDAWSQVRSRFAGLPEDVTLDTFADYVVEQQNKADEAETLRQRIAEIEARAAQQPTQQVQSQTSTASALPEDEYKLPWEPVKVDPAFRGLVTRDGSGMFVATDKSSAVHQQAAQEMNRRAAYEAQVVQDLWDDPQKFGEVLTRKQMAELRKEMNEKLEKITSQFTPIQEQVTKSAAEAQQNAFIQANESKLFADGGAFTPLGTEVDWMMREFNIPVEVALAKAEARVAASAPPVTQTPPPAQSISKVKVADKPARFVDRLSPTTRFAMDKEDSGVGTGKKHMTDADFNAKYNVRSN